jgi:hypothetical protein
MQRLVEECRRAITDNTFPAFRRSFLKTYKTTDEERRIEQKAAALKGKKASGFSDTN